MNDFTPRALVYMAQTFLTNTCILYIDNRHYGYFTWVTANTYLKWVVSICLKYVLTYLTQCLIYMQHSISREVLLTLDRWFNLAAGLWLWHHQCAMPQKYSSRTEHMHLGLLFFKAIFVILPKPSHTLTLYIMYVPLSIECLLHLSNILPEWHHYIIRIL